MTKTSLGHMLATKGLIVPKNILNLSKQLLREQTLENDLAELGPLRGDLENKRREALRILLLDVIPDVKE